MQLSDGDYAAIYGFLAWAVPVMLTLAVCVVGWIFAGSGQRR